MSKQLIDVSAEETRHLGFFRNRKVKGTILTQCLWKDTLEVSRLCEAYLDQLFEELRKDPTRKHENEFSVKLSEAELREKLGRE